MQINDLINCVFELVGATCSWINVKKYLKDREIKGIYWPLNIFFAAWGGWNLIYYPMLGQWLSFVAGTVLFAGNVTWLLFVISDVIRNRND